MKQKTKAWEYLIINDPSIDKINELGVNGWELVSVVYIPSSLQPEYIPFAITNYYFKKQIRE